jgi:hypothetical protein
LFAYLFVLLSTFGSWSRCDSIASELYNTERAFSSIRYCSCMRLADFDDFVSESKSTMKHARSCDSLKTRSDSLTKSFKEFRKTLR